MKEVNLNYQKLVRKEERLKERLIEIEKLFGKKEAMPTGIKTGVPKVSKEGVVEEKEIPKPPPQAPQEDRGVPEFLI